MSDVSVNTSVWNINENLNSNFTILLNNTIYNISSSLLIYDQTAYMLQELVNELKTNFTIMFYNFNTTALEAQDFLNELKTNFSIMFYNFNTTVFQAQDFLISLNDPIQIYTNLGNEALFNLRVVFPLLIVSISMFIIQSLFLCCVWYIWNRSNGKKINILK